MRDWGTQKREREQQRERQGERHITQDTRDRLKDRLTDVRRVRQTDWRWDSETDWLMCTCAHTHAWTSKTDRKRTFNHHHKGNTHLWTFPDHIAKLSRCGWEGAVIRRKFRVNEECAFGLRFLLQALVILILVLLCGVKQESHGATALLFYHYTCTIVFMWKVIF